MTETRLLSQGSPALPPPPAWERLQNQGKASQRQKATGMRKVHNIRQTWRLQRFCTKNKDFSQILVSECLRTPTRRRLRPAPQQPLSVPSSDDPSHRPASPGSQLPPLLPALPSPGSPSRPDSSLCLRTAPVSEACKHRVPHRTWALQSHLPMAARPEAHTLEPGPPAWPLAPEPVMPGGPHFGRPSGSSGRSSYKRGRHPWRTLDTEPSAHPVGSTFKTTQNPSPSLLY